MEVAAFLKSPHQPATLPCKRVAELLWVTTTLTDHPMDDTLPRYKAWETEASLFVTIDVLDNHPEIRHAAMEGHTAAAARGLLVLVACAIHHIAHTTKEMESTMDPTTLEDLMKSFFFNEIRNKSLAANFCTALFDTASDKTTLLEIGGGGVIRPLERHTIFITFAPTVDDTVRTVIPKELRLALIHHTNTSSKGVSPSMWHPRS